MKTALTQLIEKWETERGSYIPNAPIYDVFIADAKKFLKVEKEQIIEAWMEKTFDELIEESFYDKDRPFMYFYKEDIMPLLQQVREATIAECVEILTNPNIPKSRMASLPTDRIKI